MTPWAESTFKAVDRIDRRRQIFILALRRGRRLLDSYELEAPE